MHAAGTPVSIPTVRHETWWLPSLMFVASLIVYLAIAQGHHVHLNYFVPLADAFLHGRLNVLEHPPWLNELVPFGGKFYVVYPPMPAVLLIPFVALFGPGFNQGLLSIGMGALNVALFTRVLGLWGFGPAKNALFGAAFALGTIHWYSVQAGSSWHFAQICALSFLLLGILEALGPRRPWLMGLWLGLAAMCRLPTLMAWPFFMACLLARDWGDGRRILRSVFGFGTVAALPLIGYLLYNAARFGSPLVTGYDLIPGLLEEHQYRYGFFSVHSIPRNLYAMWLSMPRLVDNPPYLLPARLGGLSLALTTPLFLWAIKARDRSWITLGSWAAVLLISVPILLHGDPGGEQFGYRYAMDFYPFLWLLVLKGTEGRLSLERALALAMGFVVNGWGIWATLTKASL